MHIREAKNPFRLGGQTALITGGGTGLGLGMARCLAQAGARVVLVGRREDKLAGAAAAIGPLASFVANDINKLDHAVELVHAAEKAAGAPITVLINNAGTHLKQTALETTPEELQAMLTTHVCAAHALVRAVLPGMLERRQGNILFTTSMASIIGVPLVLAYSAAKSALVGMVRSLAAEVSCSGVRVNAIAPGWIETDMTSQALQGDPARLNKILARTPMGRLGAIEDVGHAAVYLCSPAAKFVTGIILPVDGGASIGF
jgi:NAD(P)-dependent dehydrogenase (short-subunit alcohol dehydrogenase family)